MKSRLLQFLLVCFLLMLVNSSTFSQKIVKLEFTGTQKDIKKTKKILERYELFLRLPGSDIKVEFKDSILATAMSIEEEVTIKDKKDITLKFIKGNRCYISPFPNGFVGSNVVSGIIIYHTKRIDNLLGFIRLKWFSKGLSINYNLDKHDFGKSLSLNIPLGMIQCKYYKGEYDNGIEAYVHNPEEKSNK